MSFHIGPRRGEVAGIEAGIVLEQFRIRHAGPPRFLQHLDGNARAAKASLAPTNARRVPHERLSTRNVFLEPQATLHKQHKIQRLRLHLLGVDSISLNRRWVSTLMDRGYNFSRQRQAYSTARARKTAEAVAPPFHLGGFLASCGGWAWVSTESDLLLSA